MRKLSDTISSSFKSEFLLFSISLFIFISFFTLLFNRLPPQIPLFYSRPDSERQVTDLAVIALLPIITLGLIIVNKIIVKRFFEDEVIAGKFIYIFNILMIIVSTYIFVKIMILAS